MEECYDNIFYKKKAVEILSVLLKEMNCQKVLFLAGKTAYQNFGTFVTNELAKANVEFVLKLVPSCVNNKNVQDVQIFSKGCDMVIALGGGSICDIAKIVSTNLQIENVLIPSIPSTTGFFTQSAYMFDNGIYKKIETRKSLKILVDESIIAKADKKYVVWGQKLVLSQFETLFSLQFENLLYDTKIDVSKLKLQLSKFKDNYEYLQSETEDSKLVLMDILIDLAKAIEFLPKNNVFAFSFCLKTKSNLPFCSLCLLSAKILSKIYLQIFALKKLYKFSMPNFDLIDKNLRFFCINNENVNFIPIKNMLNNAVFLKVNSIKNQSFVLSENFEREINDFELSPELDYFDKRFLYKSFSVAPIIYQCSSLVNLIYGVGLMNF